MSHFNYVHCWVDILPMSKRVMNKVFSCSDDLNIKNDYQGTDSTHSDYDDVGKVVEIYKRKYGQELVGDGLVNFHVDLSMEGAKSEIYGVGSFFLGKHISIF